MNYLVIGFLGYLIYTRRGGDNVAITNSAEVNQATDTISKYNRRYIDRAFNRHFPLDKSLIKKMDMIKRWKQSNRTTPVSRYDHNWKTLLPHHHEH